MDVFGFTRSKLASDYALITADTHVNSPLVGWEKASAVVHISPEMGARFIQYTATIEAGGKSGSPGVGIQRFFYVQHGKCTLAIGDSNSHSLDAGDYAFLPADVQHTINSDGETTLIVFEKEYNVHPDFDAPEPVVGKSSSVPGEPFMGDEDARLQTLLPIQGEFDMAVNIFTYQPGALL